MKKDSDAYWDLIRELDKRYEKRTDNTIPHQPVPQTTRHGGSDQGLWVLYVVMGIILCAALAVFVAGICGVFS